MLRSKIHAMMVKEAQEKLDLLELKISFNHTDNTNPVADINLDQRSCHKMEE